jgi:hypothetical protein
VDKRFDEAINRKVILMLQTSDNFCYEASAFGDLHHRSMG